MERAEGRGDGERGRRTSSSVTASLPPACRSVCGCTQVTQRNPVSRKPELRRIETCGEPLHSLLVHTTHLAWPSASSTRKSSCEGNFEIVSVAGPLAGQRANESGIAGHMGGEIDDRSLGSVKEMGQLFTDVVDSWGEKSGTGPVSGSLRGDSTALVTSMPGMISWWWAADDTAEMAGHGGTQLLDPRGNPVTTFILGGLIFVTAYAKLSANIAYIYTLTGSPIK